MKRLTIILIALLALTLTACGASSGTAVATGGAAAGDLPATTQLIIGTFKLEGTAQAVTAGQAAELLPLWQIYSQLNTSDTAAQAEVDALFDQIQETMTPEQMQAIEAMQLTQEDVLAVMQEQGVEMGGGPSAEQIATAQAAGSSGGGSGFTPPDGDFPAGGVPGQGPGDGGGFDQGLTPDQIATAQASRGAGGAGLNRGATVLIDALIQLLQERAGS